MDFESLWSQIHKFINWWNSLYGSAIDSMDKVFSKIAYAEELIQECFSFIHPAFIPIISVAISCALWIKFWSRGAH